MTSPSDPVTLRFDIDPVAASRPRHATRGSGKKAVVTSYYVGRYADFRKEFPFVRKAVLGNDFSVFQGPLWVEVDFVVQRPKTTKLDYPKPDVDNYLKAVLDVCNEHVWDDDQQIVWLSGSKRWTEDGEDPHILMVITPAE